VLVQQQPGTVPLEMYWQPMNRDLVLAKEATFFLLQVLKILILSRNTRFPCLITMTRETASVVPAVILGGGAATHRGRAARVVGATVLCDWATIPKGAHPLNGDGFPIRPRFMRLATYPR
jgi:hypothetical protein